MLETQRVIFPPITSEQLYRQDQRKMNWDEKERRLDRELAAYYERFPEARTHNPFEQHNTRTKMPVERLIALLNQFPTKAVISGDLRIHGANRKLDIRLSDSIWNQ